MKAKVMPSIMLQLQVDVNNDVDEEVIILHYQAFTIFFVID